MAKRETGTARTRHAPPTRVHRGARPAIVNAVALGGLSAVLVATPLVPSEGTAELGVGANWIMVLLLLAAAWLATMSLRGWTAVRWNAIDVLVVVFLALVSASALVMAGHGDARATINMVWQWIACGVFFLLARQVLRAASAQRAVTAVMIGLAVCLTVFAYYQYFYSLPRTRAEFARNPEAMLRDAGVDPAAGSPERKLFEDRLNSTEPLGTFALANSLAGFLAPWLVAAAGIGVATWAGGGQSGVRQAEPSPTGGPALETPRLVGQVTLAAIGAAAALGFCLLLTKSRTALLAVGLGMGLLAASRWPVRRWLTWRIMAGAGLALGLLAAAVAAGAWDRLVLTETPKSLLYRVQYWQATAAMIADYPWFGCGPGNFQHYYTAYKLPEASESIADPHNLFFEVAATAGLPALLALAAFLTLVAWQWRRRHGVGESQDDARFASAAGQPPGPAPASPFHPAADAAVLPLELRGVSLGACAGVVLGAWTGFVFGMSPEPALFLLGLPAAAATIAALQPWVRSGQLPPVVPAIAWLVLTVNLLAAGGISFAGIAPSWWLLLALVSNAATESAPGRPAGKPMSAVLAVTLGLLLVGCFLTMYSPVLRCRANLDEGLALVRSQRLNEAEAAFLAAADADPHSGEPWPTLAGLYHQAALASRDPDALARFETAVTESLRRSPHAPGLHKQIGDWRLALFAQRGQRRHLDEALRAYSEWVGLYPNQAIGHAQLAWCHHLAGDDQAAAREAAQALRLDELNPHREKKLCQQRLYDPVGESEGQRENAEQTIRRLRT